MERADGYNNGMDTLVSAEGRFVVPEKAATHFHLRDGDAVGDFGAGSGFFLSALARLVGPDGRVYAFEIQKNMVETLGEMARRNHLGNVEVLWCDIEAANGTKMKDGALDAGVLVNVLFQMEAKDAALTEIARTLRSGAKLFIIDWSESFGGLGPHPSQVVTADDAKAFAESAGLIFERSFDAGDHHYGLAFRKP